MLSLKERWPRCGAASTGCCIRVEDVILLQESSLQQGYHSMVIIWVVRPSCILNFSPHTSQSNICRFGNSSLSSFIGDTGLDFTLSELLIIFWKLLIFVSFPLVYLHTSIWNRFQKCYTWKCLLPALAVPRSHPRLNTSFSGHRIRYRVLPLFSGRPPCAWHFSWG